MTITAAELWPETQVATGSAALLFTAPLGGNGVIIKRAVFTNTTASPLTVTINKVPSGGSVTTANEVTSAFSVAANTAFVPQELINMVLPPGAAIWAAASAGTAINSTASGFLF